MNKKILSVALLVIIAIAVTSMGSCSKTNNNDSTPLQGTWKLDRVQLPGGTDISGAHLDAFFKLLLKFDGSNSTITLTGKIGSDQTKDTTITGSNTFTYSKSKVIFPVISSLSKIAGHLSDTVNVDTLSSTRLVLSAKGTTTEGGVTSIDTVIMHLGKQ